MVGQQHIRAFVAALQRRAFTHDFLVRTERAIEEFYGWWRTSGLSRERLELACLDAYRDWLAEQSGLALGTQAHRLAALRSFLGHLTKHGHLSGALAELVPLPKVPATMRRVLSERELLRLCAAVSGKDPVSRRDRAYLELLVATAMRTHEAAALVTSDLDLGRGRVRIRRGKGDKLRWLPLTRAAVRALRTYRKVRPRILRRGVRTDRLFVSGIGTFSQLAVDVVARAAAAAGIEGHVTPYTIRHSVATALVRAGVELRHLQALLGHVRVQTTEVYLHLGPQDLKAAHRRAHPRERNPREPRARRRT